MPDKDLTDMGTWEGQMIQLQKSTESIVNANTASLESRLDRVWERLLLSENNEDRQERLFTMQINRLGDMQSSFRKEIA